jgi:hypothetical protein
MIALLLLIMIAATAGWFAWLYLVSPRSDLERIEADQGGTGIRVVGIKRVGTQRDRPEAIWVGERLTPVSGATWFRVYEVTLARPDGLVETCSIGVEARLFGLAAIKRYELRAGM